MGAPMEQENEFAPYYIPYVETLSDGTVNEYKFYIQPDSDYIEWVQITHMDSTGIILDYVTYSFGGNGPIPGDMDIFAEVSAPADVKVIELTVVSPAGEKTYSIRKDAAIFWKGEALYSDEACTTAVTDLNWVTGSEATVYVK